MVRLLPQGAWMARYGYGQPREAAFSPQLVLGVLKGQIWQTDSVSSQHNSFSFDLHELSPGGAGEPNYTSAFIKAIASYCCGSSVTVVLPGGRRPRRALRAASRCCTSDCAKTSATGSGCGVIAPISCCKRA